MMKFFANPDYVPGGVHNFWSRAPVGQDGEQVMAAGAADSQTGQSPSMIARFFMNPVMVQEQMDCAGKVQEKESPGVKSSHTVKGGDIGLIDRSMRVLAALNTSSMYKFQY